MMVQMGKSSYYSKSLDFIQKSWIFGDFLFLLILLSLHQTYIAVTAVDLVTKIW